MIQWDEEMSARITNSNSVQDYYNRASLAPSDPSHHDFGKQNRVAVPLLCVQAQNDTAVDVNSMDVSIPESNPNIMFVVTKSGGHCGWPLGMWPIARGHERQTSFVIDFVDALVKYHAANTTGAPEVETTAEDA